MDYLREGIHLRGFAQIDPLVAYKNEGFSMFEVLMYSIWEEFARMIFHVQVEVAPQAQQELAPAQRPANVNYSGGTPDSQPSAMEEIAQAAAAQASAGGAAAPGVTGPPAASPAPAPVAAQGGNGGDATNPQTVVKDEQEKIGRNDPCWCGSGKKYKKCHGA